MYYCSRSKEIPYSREKINARMLELAELIPVVAAQPREGELEMVGDLNYNHPVTELIVEYRVLMYKAMNPPDPRGEKMYSRPAPYVVRAYAKDLAIALDIHLRTVQRSMKIIKDKLQLKERAWLTVEEFIIMNELPNPDVIHEKLSRLMQERWKQVKDKQEEDDEDE